MVRSLNTGISGMQQFQQRLDVIGNNIANANTTGYKSARVDFADSFSQTLRQSSGSTATNSNVAAMQVGTGVTAPSIKNLYTPGAVARTGVPTDLAISGEGFFVVRDTISDSKFVTRAGDFRLDDSGYLVTNSGYRVQGISATLPSTTEGDIRIDADGRTSATGDPLSVQSFTIDTTGTVNVRLSDGTQIKRGQLLLQKFNDPNALVKEGFNLYSGIEAAGPLKNGATIQAAAPGEKGLGRVEMGALELSNVDLANEFANLITTQRAFQASARIITTSDDILQELVNLKR
jgi:flagellar hook protein FlgE